MWIIISNHISCNLFFYFTYEWGHLCHLIYKKLYHTLISKKDREKVQAYTAPFPSHAPIIRNWLKLIKKEWIRKVYPDTKNREHQFNISNFEKCLLDKEYFNPTCNKMLKIHIWLSLSRAVKGHRKWRGKNIIPIIRVEGWKYRLTMKYVNTSPEKHLIPPLTNNSGGTRRKWLISPI